MTEPVQHETLSHPDDVVIGDDGKHEFRGVDAIIAGGSASTTDWTEILRLTETADAERMRDLYVGVIRWVTDVERWAVWNGERWQYDLIGDLKVFALVQGVTNRLRVEALSASDEPGAGPGNMSPRALINRHALATEAVSTRRAIMRAAAALPELQALSTDFDSDHNVIACADTLLTLGKTTTTRPVRRSDMLMSTARTSYDPNILDAPPSAITEYLTTFIRSKNTPAGEFDKVTERLLFKTLGVCLLGGNPHRLFVIIQGESTTGKTQLAEAITEMLGPEYATTGSASVFRGNLDDRPRPDILKALSKRIAFFSEASKAWELHGDRVKDLTGGGTVSARGMHSNEFIDVRPNFTPVLVTNTLPRITGRDPALLRRMIVFEFNNRPVVEDATIRDRFVHDPAVHKWLLARMIRGLEDAETEGMSDVITSQGLATMTAYESLTHIGSFFQWLGDTDQIERVGLDEQKVYGVKSTYATLEAMYSRYSYWVKEFGDRKDNHEKYSYAEFNQQLINQGWERKKSGKWRWVGYRLKSLATLMGDIYK